MTATLDNIDIRMQELELGLVPPPLTYSLSSDSSFTTTTDSSFSSPSSLDTSSPASGEPMVNSDGVPTTPPDLPAKYLVRSQRVPTTTAREVKVEVADPVGIVTDDARVITIASSFPLVTAEDPSSISKAPASSTIGPQQHAETETDTSTTDASSNSPEGPFLGTPFGNPSAQPYEYPFPSPPLPSPPTLINPPVGLQVQVQLSTHGHGHGASPSNHHHGHVPSVSPARSETLSSVSTTSSSGFAKMTGKLFTDAPVPPTLATALLGARRRSVDSAFLDISSLPLMQQPNLSLESVAEAGHKMRRKSGSANGGTVESMIMSSSLLTRRRAGSVSKETS